VSGHDAARTAKQTPNVVKFTLNLHRWTIMVEMTLFHLFRDFGAASSRAYASALLTRLRVPNCASSGDDFLTMRAL
jgi:hypothetical protein